MQKKKKAKLIEPRMEFNPGIEKYEPILPLRKGKENIKKRIDKRDLIALIIVLIIVGIVGYALIHYGVFLK